MISRPLHDAPAHYRVSISGSELAYSCDGNDTLLRAAQRVFLGEIEIGRYVADIVLIKGGEHRA